MGFLLKKDTAPGPSPPNLGPKCKHHGYDGAPGLSRDDKTLYSNRETAGRPVMYPVAGNCKTFGKLRTHKTGCGLFMK